MGKKHPVTVILKVNTLASVTNRKKCLKERVLQKVCLKEEGCSLQIVGVDDPTRAENIMFWNTLIPSSEILILYRCCAL